MEQLTTQWGGGVDPDHVWEVYPRPLLKRENWISLNGYWDYAFTKEKKKPAAFEERILVPFSPESALSGVGRQLQPDEFLWYRRTFRLEGFSGRKAGRRLALHFGAVDQSCAVYVNGKLAASHTGGYLPFSASIGDLVCDGENELTVAVRDLTDTSYHARGKQKLQAGGMFYTAVSGIWQTVWMEETPAAYIRSVTCEPDLAGGSVYITVHAGGDGGGQNPAQAAAKEVAVRIGEPRIYREGEVVWPGQTLAEAAGEAGRKMRIPLPRVCPWNCEEPWLYAVSVRMGEDGAQTYFAMRAFTLEADARGIPRICLNGKPQFQYGVLDQGYWPEGIYTAPSDEAVVWELEEMRRSGFCMVRKHAKIEPQRWYYHCDRLGLVVWQDMVNGGGRYHHWFVTYAATVLSWRGFRFRDSCRWLLSRRSRAGRREFVREMLETIRVLKGHPSIAVWALFNEGWGQFDAQKLTRLARRADPSRLIDQASGWFDQGGGDFKSVHNYFFPLLVRPERERASVLSEIGGYPLRISGHCACGKQYGYGKYKDREALNGAYRDLCRRIRALEADGLCAAVYTQWTDIEEEVNGIYTFDRKVRKIDPLDPAR